MRRYRLILRYAVTQWPRLLVMLALNAVAAGLAMLQPWPMKLLVDRALAGPRGVPPADAVGAFAASLPPKTFVIAAAVTTLLLFVGGNLVSAASTWTWTLIGRRIVNGIALEVFRRLQRLSLLFHAQRRVGDSLMLLTVDAACASTVTEALLFAPLASLTTILTLGYVAWQLDPALTMLSLTVVPVLAAAARTFGTRLLIRARTSRQAQARVLAFVHQTLSAIPLVQAFGAEAKNVRTFRSLFDDETDRLRQEAVLKGKLGIVRELIPTAGIAIVLYAGGAKVLAGSMAVGSLIVFLAYQRTMQRALRGLLQSYESLKSAQANIERLCEVLDSDDEVPELPGAKPLPAGRSGAGVSVRWEGVEFGYEAGRPVLHGMDLEVRAGERVALVGTTGAGKSTLVGLVPRFFDPWAGRVLIDGVDVRTAQVASVRAQVALVLQESFMLPLSIAENIGYGRPGASRGEIEEAAGAAQAHEFIMRLPKGYDTVVGERGATLSGGERQRLAIARALLKDAPILILDEPTSALDVETEAQVLAALERLMAGRTVLVIAHRLSTVRHADRIVVLQGGRIVESGTHDELLAAKGVYRRLTQFAMRTPGAA